MRRWWSTCAVLTVALALVACGGGDPAQDEVTTTEPRTEPEAEPDPGEEEPEPDAEQDPDASAEPEAEPEDEGDAEAATAASDDEAAPQPSAEAVRDPCSEHAGREGEMFIDLVAPVDEQHVDGEVEIVGCSNVNEATVSYRVLDGDGRTLDEGFTTAECGTGCVGEFREVVDLGAAEGEPVAYLQVFAQSMADGSDEALTEVMVILE